MKVNRQYVASEFTIRQCRGKSIDGNMRVPGIQPNLFSITIKLKYNAISCLYKARNI